MSNSESQTKQGHSYKEISFSDESTGITGDYSDFRGSRITIHNHTSCRLPYEIDRDTHQRLVTAQAFGPGQIQVIKIPPLRLDTESHTLKAGQVPVQSGEEIDRGGIGSSRPRISPQQNHISSQALLTAYTWSESPQESALPSTRSSSRSRIPRLSTASSGHRGSSLSRFSKLSDTPVSSIPSSATDLTRLSALSLDEATEDAEKDSTKSNLNKEVPWTGHQFDTIGTDISDKIPKSSEQVRTDCRPLPSTPETKREALDVSLHQEFHHLKLAMEAFERRLSAREAACRKLCGSEEQDGVQNYTSSQKTGRSDTEHSAARER